MTVRHRRHGTSYAIYLLLASLFVSTLWSLLPHGVTAQEDTGVLPESTETVDDDAANDLQATELSPAVPDDPTEGVPVQEAETVLDLAPAPLIPTATPDPIPESTVASGPSPPSDDEAISPGEAPVLPAANEITAPLEVSQQATENGGTSFSGVTISPPTNCSVSEPVTGTLLLNNPPSGGTDIFDGIFVTLFGRDAQTAEIVQLGSTSLSAFQDEGLHSWGLVGDFSTTYDQWHITVSLVAFGIGSVQSETFPVVPACGNTGSPPLVVASFEIVEFVPPQRCTETITFSGIVNLQNAGAEAPGSVHIRFVGVTPTGSETVHSTALIPGSLPDGNHAFTSLPINPFGTVGWILRFTLQDINGTVIQSETRSFDLDCTDDDDPEDTNVGNAVIEPVTDCVASTIVRGTIDLVFNPRTDYAVILQIRARDETGLREPLGEPIRLAPPDAITGTNAWEIASIDFSDRYDQWELLVFESGDGFDDSVAILIVTIPVNCVAIEPTEPVTPPDPTVVDPAPSEPTDAPATQAPPGDPSPQAPTSTAPAPVVMATESTAGPPVAGLPSAGVPQHHASFPVHLALTAVLLFAGGAVLRISETGHLRQPGQ